MILNDEKKKEIFYFIIMFLLGVVYCAPRLFRADFPYCYPEDAEFHLNRLIGLENVWTSPINYNSGSRLGSLVNVYYPWLTMYPMWIIYKMCGNLIVSLNIYTMFLTILTMYIVFFCFRKICKDNIISFVCAVVYTFSAYRFADVFRRVALGETISLAFLPIVVLGVYYIFISDYKKWRTLFVGMTLIAYTHLLSLMLTSLFVGIVGLLLLIKADRKKERIRYFILSAFASALVSIGALCPIIATSMANNLKSPSGYTSQFLENTDSIVDILINALFNEPTAHGVGLLIFIILIANIILVSADRNKKRRITAILLSVVAVALIVMTSSCMPWGMLSTIPVISLIQFPWRLNAYATLFALLGFMVSFSSVDKEKKKTYICLGFCAISVFLTVLLFFRLNKDINYILTDEYIVGNHEGKFDYTPSAYFEYFVSTGIDVHEDDYFVSGEKISSKHYNSKSGTYHYFTIEDIKKEDSVEMPLFWYSTTHVLIDGEEVKTKITEKGTILLEPNKEGKIEIVVFNKYSPIIYLSWIVSFAVFVALFAKTGLNKLKIVKKTNK